CPTGRSVRYPAAKAPGRSRGFLPLPTGGNLIATRSLRAIQRTIRGDQHVLILPLRPVLGDPNARRYEPFRIAHPHPDLLHRGPHLLPHPDRALFARPHQYHNELVSAIAARPVGGADEAVALARRLAQHHLAGLVPAPRV